MKITKNTYLKGFAYVVLALTVVRLIAPKVMESKEKKEVEILDLNVSKSLKVPEKEQPETKGNSHKNITKDNSHENTKKSNSSKNKTKSLRPRDLADSQGNAIRHRIIGVPRYRDAFPDSQQVQLESAQQWGVMAVESRADAESRKQELVYIGASPFYHVDRLVHSVPYLVPRAAVLLNDIGRAYFDSLQLKGLPLHQFIITSVLRTRSDVGRLRTSNRNATENSCHLYGTTFDISYRRYLKVWSSRTKNITADEEKLKQVLSEVLNDMRQQQRCYVKHEVKQGCFHITVR